MMNLEKIPVVEKEVDDIGDEDGSENNSDIGSQGDDDGDDDSDILNFADGQSDIDEDYDSENDDLDEGDDPINDLQNGVKLKSDSNATPFMVEQNPNNTFIIDEFVRKEELEMKLENEDESPDADVVNDEPYNFKKFEEYDIDSYIENVHPEMLVHNINEIYNLLEVKRTSEGIIVDPLHRTIPCLTKYERTRIIGQRAKQIEYGVDPLMTIPSNITDCITIAEMELYAKKLPFIIRRPIPNGSFEYWRLEDLEIL